MQIKNLSNNQIIAHKVMTANTFFKRLKGLMFRKGLDEGEALIIEPCNMIHTFGMRFAIDVLFITKDNAVEHLIEKIPSNKISPMIYKVSRVIELPAGIISKTNLQKGDILDISISF